MKICFISYIVITDLYIKPGEIYIDTDEFYKCFRLCFFTKIQLKRFCDIINFKLITQKNKITKAEIIDICNDNDEINEIFFKNFNNEEEIETMFEDEIYIMCDSNLKKSKYFFAYLLIKFSIEWLRILIIWNFVRMIMINLVV